MRKRLSLIGLVLLIVTMMFGSSVFAFGDIQGDANEADIRALHNAGVVNGIADDLFAPKGNVTIAQSVVMLVKGFQLNIDHIRFIKEPKASDYFTNVPDDAWYAEAFIIAQLNGVPIPKDVDPTQNVSKELFAHLLFNAMITKGDYAFIEMWVMLKDEDDVNKEYMSSIQRLLVTKIAALQDGYFYPKQETTRSEAARMLHQAMLFVKKMEEQQTPSPEQPNVTMSVYKVNEDVNRVVVTWAEAPNPGYRIKVSHIAFTADGQAIISYETSEPEPGKMYPQVITDAKAETYVSSAYKPVLAGHDIDPDTPVSSNETGASGEGSAGSPPTQ